MSGKFDAPEKPLPKIPSDPFLVATTSPSVPPPPIYEPGQKIKFIPPSVWMESKPAMKLKAGPQEKIPNRDPNSGHQTVLDKLKTNEDADPEPPIPPRPGKKKGKNKKKGPPLPKRPLSYLEGGKKSLKKRKKRKRGYGGKSPKRRTKKRKGRKTKKRKSRKKRKRKTRRR